MSKKIKIKLNRDGVRDLLRSKAMMDICTKHAKTAINRCGPGYEINTRTGRNRVNAEIFARTYQAKSDNRKNDTIRKALGG